MSDGCPICDDPATCLGYAHLYRRLREDRRLWEPVHAIVNGLASPIRRPYAESTPPPAPVLGVPLGGCCH